MNNMPLGSSGKHRENGTHTDQTDEAHSFEKRIKFLQNHPHEFLIKVSEIQNLLDSVNRHRLS